MIANSVSSSQKQSSSHATDQTNAWFIRQSNETNIQSGIKDNKKMNEIFDEDNKTRVLMGSKAIDESSMTKQAELELDNGGPYEREQLMNTASFTAEVTGLVTETDQASTSSDGMNILEDCSPQKRREKRQQRRRRKSLMEILFV